MNKKYIDTLRLAIPATLENVLQASIGFIDTYVVASLGVVIVSSVSLANSIIAIYLAIFIALSVATSSMVSRYKGANREDIVRRVSSKSLIYSLIVGSIITLVTLVFGKTLLNFIGASGELLSSSYLFLCVVSITMPFNAYTIVGGSIIRSSGDTKTTLLINGFSNVLNIVIDIILVFGIGPFPPLGILGTALGTALSKIVSMILIRNYLKRRKLNINLTLIWDKSEQAEFLDLTVPSLIERLLMRVGQVVYFGMILTIGVNTYAAHMLVGTIETFNYMPGYGLAAAVTVLVGRSIGEGNIDNAKEYNKIAIKIGFIVMGLLGVVLFFGSSFLANMFSSEQEVIERIITALKVDAFIQPFLAISLVVTASLQASGDTKSPLIATTIGIWIIRVVGIYCLAIVLKMDILGIWLTLLIEQILKNIYLFKKFNQKIRSLNNYF